MSENNEISLSNENPSQDVKENVFRDLPSIYELCRMPIYCQSVDIECPVGEFPLKLNYTWVPIGVRRIAHYDEFTITNGAYANVGFFNKPTSGIPTYLEKFSWNYTLYSGDFQLHLQISSNETMLGKILCVFVPEDSIDTFNTIANLDYASVADKVNKMTYFTSHKHFWLDIPSDKHAIFDIPFISRRSRHRMDNNLGRVYFIAHRLRSTVNLTVLNITSAVTAGKNFKFHDFIGTPVLRSSP